MAEGLLKGKRGVVLGVANDKSIAWSCAKECAAQGAELVFSYPGEALERRVRKLLDAEMPDAPMYLCDVRDDAQIRDFFARVKEKWGGLDFVIHSVAYAEREDLMGRFVDTPRANFMLAIDVSAYSLVAVAREAAPLMTQGGSIIAMTYFGGEKVVPRYNVMGVAKATLDMCMRYLAADLGPQNIRVNCISPGPLRTLSASAISGFKLMHDMAQHVAPLRRNIETEEVGPVAVFLLSDMASGITGEVLHVDAGYNILGMYGQLPEGQ
jgi:enoyl-[acyl-carrier protein] reductase I